MKTVSHHSALIYVMVIVSAADGVMSPNELRTIGDLVKTLPVFRDFDTTRLVAVSQECGEVLQEADGLAAALGLVKDALPEHLCETAYWLALEIALSDNRVALEEIRVIETIRRTLGIERLIAAAIERGARARHQIA
ncbi:MAG TPA: tellurite resistance TerB family protein [Rhizomicrobium sp.]